MTAAPSTTLKEPEVTETSDKYRNILRSLRLFGDAETVLARGGDAGGILEEASTFAARALGFRIEPPSNLSYTSMTRSPDADPYANREMFEALPSYGTDLADAMRLAPEQHDLSLHQEGDVWRASYLPRVGSKAERPDWSRSRDPARAVAMAALNARLRPEPAA